MRAFIIYCTILEYKYLASDLAAQFSSLVAVFHLFWLGNFIE